MWDLVNFKMAIRPLSKQLQDLAVSKLNENPLKLEDDLKYIREWVKTQPELKIRADDQWLLSFLRGCKFDLKKVERKLSFLYTMKSLTPEWFANRDPFLPEIQGLLKLGTCLPLPNTESPAGPRVILFRECAETLNFQLDVKVKLAFMALDILIYEDDNFLIAGGCVIGDSRHTTFRHLLHVKPNHASKGYDIINKGYAARPTGFYCLNVPWFVTAAFNTYKYLARKQHLDLVRFYNNQNIDELYESVPLALLPEEYSGNGGSVADLTLKWKEKVESYRDWFLSEEQYCSDKPEKPNTSENFFDMEDLLD